MIYCSDAGKTSFLALINSNQETIIPTNFANTSEHEITYTTFKFYLNNNCYKQAEKLLNDSFTKGIIENKKQSDTFFMYLVVDCMKKGTNQSHLHLLNIIKKQHDLFIDPAIIETIVNISYKNAPTYDEFKFDYKKSLHDLQLVSEILENTNQIPQTDLMQKFLAEFDEYKKCKKELEKFLKSNEANEAIRLLTRRIFNKNT